MVRLLSRRSAGGADIRPVMLRHLSLHAGEIDEINLAQAQLAAEFIAA